MARFQKQSALSSMRAKTYVQLRTKAGSSEPALKAVLLTHTTEVKATTDSRQSCIRRPSQPTAIATQETEAGGSQVSRPAQAQK
jgi:hypothetical protein